MKVERLSRLSRRLLAALEDFQVVEDTSLDTPNIYTGGEKAQTRELKVVKSEKTRAKLEKWFRERDIPIRIVYGGMNFRQEEENTKNFRPNVSPIGKPGVITYYYAPVGQDPPTAWMIVHNLSHAIHEPRVYNKESPHEVIEKGPHNPLKKDFWHPDAWEETHNLMGDDRSRPAIYPTTRSYKLDKIEEPGEAFHELFTQWVVKGQVILRPRNPALEKRLDTDFRSRIDYLADRGAVVYNV